MKKIQSALISVFDKTGIDKIARKLHKNNIHIISTGGTQKHIESLNIPVTSVESLTDYPSILGGRVKTLHPKIFGGILFRDDHSEDLEEIKKYNLPKIDLVIVDLYPFGETVKLTEDESEIIEKVDIGGVSLLRASAKNYSKTLVVSSRNNYNEFISYMEKNNYSTDINFRKKYASKAFRITSEYDSQIDSFFGVSSGEYPQLRYGENPHQKAIFKGDLGKIFDKINGKDLSYNNLLDINSAIRLISEFKSTTFAIIKHNNACGIASCDTVLSSYKKALISDPLSAFGGVLITNEKVDEDSANEINKLFFEVLIAPEFDDKSLDILKEKRNRIILRMNNFILDKLSSKKLLGGYLQQDLDTAENKVENWSVVTETKPSNEQIVDLEFANKIVKHSKSNAIVLVKGNQMISSGVGQTSRVDALKHAIEKAKTFGFKVEGSVMASDAFFPFPDCIEIASNAGVHSVVQPGGSIKDNLSIDTCNKAKISMVITGMRHFYH
jgi:phosphoribosylaminoimidazolecarboxamide formyltransferase/IMP cyclohydrolase